MFKKFLAFICTTLFTVIAGAQTQVTDFDEGYYYIINDNAKIEANGKPAKAMYTNYDSNLLYWGTLETNSLKFVFKITSNGDGTYTLQNVGNGLYAGAAIGYVQSTSATACNDYSVTIYSVGEGSYYLKANGWTYCPQGNPLGDKDGPSYIHAYNGETLSGGLSPHLEWNWRFQSVPEEEVNTLMATELGVFLSDKSAVSNNGDPNTYTETSATTYNNVLQTAQNAMASGTDAEKAAAYLPVVTAYNQLTRTNIVAGFYYIVSAGNGTGYSGGPYNYEDRSAMYNDGGIVKWKAYDRTDITQVYYLKEATNGWYAYNLANNTYINKGKSGHNCDVTTSSTADNSQIFDVTVAGSGKFAITWDGGVNRYALANSHDGSSGASGNVGVWGNLSEAKSYGVNVWYLHKADETLVNNFINDNLGTLVASKSTLVGSTDPNRIPAAEAAAFNTALANAQTAITSGTPSEKVDAYLALLDADATASAACTTVTEGYYFITSAGNGPGYSGGPYNYEDKNALYNNGGIVKWKAYDRTDASQLYYLTQKAGNSWYVYNVKDASYIDNGGTQNSGTVHTSTDKVNGQEFHAMALGSGKFAIKSPSYCYGLAQNHNGSPNAEGNLCIWGNVNESRVYGVNVWYLHRVTEEEVETIKKVIAKESLEEAISVGVGYVNGIKDEASMTDVKDLLAGTPTLEELQYALDNYVAKFTDGYYRIVYPYDYRGADSNNYLRFGNDLKLYADITEGNLDDYSTVFKASIISTETRAAGNGYRMTLTSQGLTPTDKGNNEHQVMGTKESQFAIAIRHDKTLAEYLIGISNAAGDYVDTRYIYKKPQTESWKIYSTTGNAQSARCLFALATDITIKMNKVGDDYWATLYVPFGVTLPTGFEAFVGAVDGDVLRLTSIDQDIPAATPVVIVGDAANITATINDEIPEYTGTNALSGQYLAASSPDYNIRSLGVKDGVIGFYKLPTASTGLGANKAFLNMSSGSQGLKVVLDDDVTAVNTAIVNDQSSMVNDYYDLQGRKVVAPQKGSLYIKDGKVVKF